LAALVAIWDIGVGVAVVVGQQNPGSIAGAVVFVLCGVAGVAGLVLRAGGDRRRSGPLLVLAGMAAIAIVWTVVPPILGLLVVIGVLTDREPARSEPAQ
jgi:hypothetical protein